jgi:hypothetical protein
MMQPFVRNAGIWAFSGLFGCISLLGPGWHALFGHVHHGHHELHPASHCHEDGAGCHPHRDDDRQHACTHGSSDGAAAIAAASFSDADHECAICSFFSQAQWVAVFESASRACAVCELLVLAEPAPRVLASRIYQSRAPPAIPAAC